jgi:hypothetical protein
VSWFWLNVPLMAVFFLAWSGIPLWLVLRHPDTAPVSSAEDLTAKVDEPVGELVGAGR